MRRPLLLGVGVLLAVGGCGESGDPTEPGSATEEPARTQLQVIVRTPDLGGGGLRFDLVCDPPGGDHPNAGAACEALAEHPEALEPVPPDTACAEIYGGPEEAEVSGTVTGRGVEATFERTNACEIDRWDRLAPLFDVKP